MTLARPAPSYEEEGKDPATARPALGLVTRPMAAPLAPPSRRNRRMARRRLVREQVAVCLVLLVILGVTVLLLCLEWLTSGSVASNAPAVIHSVGAP